MIRQDELAGVIGPLGGDSSSRYWCLLVGPDRLVGWPYTFGESMRAELAMRYPFVSDPAKKLLSGDPVEFHRALEGRQMRLHLRSDLDSLEVRVRSLQNQIVLHRKGGGAETYTIRDRASTDRWRELLRGRFPEIYAEKGVPTTVLSRALKR